MRIPVSWNHYKLRTIDIGLFVEELYEKSGMGSSERLISDHIWNHQVTKIRARIPAQSATKTIPLYSHGGKLNELNFLQKFKNRRWPGSEYDSIIPWPEHIDRFPECDGFLKWFVEEYGGELHRAVLVKLDIGASVGLHRDGGRYYKDKDRFHLVIQGEYLYTVNEESMIYKQGDLWWFNNKKPHKSTNISNQERVALIFDVKGSTWRTRSEQVESI